MYGHHNVLLMTHLLKKVCLFFTLLMFAYATAANAATCSSVTQAGITINFTGSSGDPVCGQFANQEWWIVDAGTVNVTSMSPAFTGSQNGYEINPVSKVEGIQLDRPQSIDSRIARGTDFFDPETKYGSKTDLDLVAGDSLLKVDSRSTCTSNNPTRLTCIDNAIVLTVLAASPETTPKTCALPFRPGYSGTTKTIYCADDIDWTLLGELSLLSTQQQTVAFFEGKYITPGAVYLDHGFSAASRYYHNLLMFHGHDTSLGVEYGSRYTNLILAFMIRTLQGPDGGGSYANEAAKIADLKLLTYLGIQIGIDTHQNVTYGGMKYKQDGGIMRARRTFPIYAGALLGDETLMQSAGDYAQGHIRVGGGVGTHPVWGRNTGGAGCPPSGGGGAKQAANLCETPPERDGGWPAFGCNKTSAEISQETVAAQIIADCGTMASYQVYADQDYASVLIPRLLGEETRVDDLFVRYVDRISAAPWNYLCKQHCNPFLNQAAQELTSANTVSVSATCSPACANNMVSVASGTDVDFTGIMVTSEVGDIDWSLDCTDNGTPNDSATNQDLTHVFTTTTCSYTTNGNARITGTRNLIEDSVTVAIEILTGTAITATSDPSPADIGSGESVTFQGHWTGTDTGTILWKLDCTNNASWEQEVSNEDENYIFTTTCAYTANGIAKIQGTRGGNTDSDTVTVTIVSLSVLSLGMYDSGGPNNTTIGSTFIREITPGMSINLNAASTCFAIHPQISVQCASLRWNWSGPSGVNRRSEPYNETNDPYGFTGDTGWFLEDEIPILKCNFDNLLDTGSHTITAKCFPQENQFGTPGPTFSRTFTITDESGMIGVGIPGGSISMLEEFEPMMENWQ